MNPQAARLTVRGVLRDLKQNLFVLVGTDLAFKLLAFVVLTPVVSLLFRVFLFVSGRSVLADTDIAVFLLHPIGWATAVVVGGALLAVLALEQGALIAIVLTSSQGESASLMTVFRFLADRAAGLFRLTLQIVGKILLTSVPFLLIGGGLFLFLLTDHDINYYLSLKPPRFWIAVVSIGGVLALMFFMLLRQLVGWMFALQVFLFENRAVAEAFSVGQSRTRGHAWTALKAVAVWFLVGTLATFLLSCGVVLFSRLILPTVDSPMWRIMIFGGAALLLVALTNFVAHLLMTLSLAIVLARLFLLVADREALVLPSGTELSQRVFPRWTLGRLVSAVIVVTLLACLMLVAGATAVERDIDVQITAHRGASAQAPENTLASIQLAIDQGADWVEIDVQESKDGVVVVAHDSDLKKVSGVDTKIWEATAAELRSIDIGSYFDPQFHQERVPTLAEVLNLCRGKVGVVIELKYYGHDQQLEQRVVDLVEEYEMSEDVLVISLKLNGLQKIKRLRPDFKVGLLTAVTMTDLTRVDVDFFAVKTTLATPAFVNLAHVRGKNVAVWTVNDEIAMATMIRRGVDNLITDKPGLAREVVQEQAGLSLVERFLFDVAMTLGENPLKDHVQ